MIPVSSKHSNNPILFTNKENISQKLNINIAAERNTATERPLKLPKLSAPKGERTNPPSRRDLVARARALKGSTFEHVPKTVTGLIQNFIEPKQIATNIHPVNSEWRHLWGDNGHLDLSNSNITNDDLKRIIQEYKKCRQLVSVNLSNCKYITDAGLAPLAGIPLKQLNLSSTYTTNAGLAYFANAPLEQVDLSACPNITDAGLPYFANAPLEQLHLRLCCNVTDAGLAYRDIYIILNHHLNPTKLGKINDHVSHSDYPTPKSLIYGYLEERTNPPSRRDLVARARALKGSTFEHVPKTVTSLIQNFIEPKQIATNIHPVNSEWRHLWGDNGHLDLSNSNITNDDLKRIIQEYKKCGKLVSVNLSNCEFITDEGLAHLAGIPLKQLNLSGCTNITNEGLAYFANTPLTQLNLSYCFHINDAGLAYFANAPLIQLDLSRTGTTDAGLAYFANAPLTQLDISFTDITDEGLAYFANARLTQLDLPICNIVGWDTSLRPGV